MKEITKLIADIEKETGRKVKSISIGQYTKGIEIFGENTTMKDVHIELEDKKPV